MKRKKIPTGLVIPAMAIALSCSLAKEGGRYEKSVSFPKESSIGEKVKIASQLVPTARQLDWQRMELTAFLHFGINTFTGREWGTGSEDPALFDPQRFDAEQWVKTLKDNGFKMALLTAKHHDGFCLWPTKTTAHSVARSPWRDGAGDVVGELKEACDKHGIRFGVYLSPWDRNAECYGTPEYNAFLVEQLTELLTNYGEIYEVWFDGANGEGPNGKKQEYDWELILGTIHKLQPKAVTAIMGDDVRWVGNEGGMGRETEWSATVLTPGCYDRASAQNKDLEVDAMAKDLGSRQKLERATELFWYPSEVDVSIRPGWFYHEEEDEKVKSLEKLVDIYFKSVGCNSLLLLNIPPDRSGLINKHDADRLNEFSEYLSEVFAGNQIDKGERKRTANEGKPVEYSLKSDSPSNVILLQEDITKGQRVERFYIEASIDGNWERIAEGTTIGYKRLLRVPDFVSPKIRLTIAEARGTAHISGVGAFYARPIAAETDARVLNEAETAGWQVVNPAGAPKSIYEGIGIANWKSADLSPLVINLQHATEITGFTYTPVSGDDKSGTIFSYNFYISGDGETWRKIAGDSEFGNIENNPVTQYVRLKGQYKANFVKMEVTGTVGDKAYYSVGKFGLLVKE